MSRAPAETVLCQWPGTCCFPEPATAQCNGARICRPVQLWMVVCLLECQASGIMHDANILMASLPAELVEGCTQSVKPLWQCTFLFKCYQPDTMQACADCESTLRKQSQHSSMSARQTARCVMECQTATTRVHIRSLLQYAHCQVRAEQIFHVPLHGAPNLRLASGQHDRVTE